MGSSWQGAAAFPEPVQPQEELDFLRSEQGAGDLHGAFAAGAAERVAAPDAENQVAPQRAQGAGGLFGRRGHQQDFVGRGLPA